MDDIGVPCAVVAVAACIVFVFGAINSGISSVRDFFSPARIVINGVSPAEIKVNYLYTVTPDGPYRATELDKNGNTVTRDFGPNGSCVSNCGVTPLKDKDRLVRITSLDPTRQVHFTLKECRVREAFFRNVCD